MSKVAVVTGVRRIGFYVAQFLLSKGYDLGILYKSSIKEVEELKTYADRLGLRVVALRADLSDPESYAGKVQKIYEELGKIDALLNVASPFEKTPLETLTPREFEKHWRAIVEAALFLTLEAARFMKKNEGTVKGRVINFGDQATFAGRPYKNFAAYLIAKGGLDTLTKVLALELAPEVLVNEIALGPVLPPNFGGGEKTEGWSDYLKRSTLLKRPVGIEDLLAATDLFLRTKSVSGEILTLDAGQRFLSKGY